MAEIEQLIKQAKAVRDNYHKAPDKPNLTDRSWQEILDGQPYPKLNVKNP